MEKEKDFLTIPEVAEMLRVSVDTVRNYISRKKDALPAYRLGREYRIRPDELEQWLQERKNIQED